MGLRIDSNVQNNVISVRDAVPGRLYVVTEPHYHGAIVMRLQGDERLVVCVGRTGDQDQFPTVGDYWTTPSFNVERLPVGTKLVVE